MNRQIPRGATLEQLQIEIGERVARVHHQHKPPQRRALPQVTSHQAAPVLAHRLGHAGVAVAGQIHEITRGLHLKEIQQLSAAGGFTDPRQTALAGQQIQGARFARIGAAGEGRFASGIGRELR